MCVDSAVKPDDLQGPVGLWPCHNQGGNQVFQRTKNLSLTASSMSILLVNEPQKTKIMLNTTIGYFFKFFLSILWCWML